MKKWTYLVAAGMLLGATPVFTGCIDNDEPEGITNLRGAKAELLSAKAAVEAAKVAQVQADAALTQAQAKVQEAEAMKVQAEAKKIEAEAKIAEAQAALLNAQTESEKATLQGIIDANERAQKEWEEKAAQRAAEAEAAIKAAEYKALEAQAKYQQALVALQTSQQRVLKEYITKLETATSNYYDALDDLRVAQRNVNTQDATIKENEASKELLTRGLQKEVNIAEAGLNGANEALKVANEELADAQNLKPSPLADKLKAVEEKYNTVQKEIADLSVQAAEKVVEFYQSGRYEDVNKLLDAAFDALEAPQTIASIEFDFGDGAGYPAYIERGIVSYPESEYSAIETDEYINRLADLKYTLDEFKSWTRDENDDAWTKERIARLEGDLTELDKTIATKKAVWQEAVNAYNTNNYNESDITKISGYDKVVTEITAFNKAAEALNKALAEQVRLERKIIADQEVQTKALKQNETNLEKAKAEANTIYEKDWKNIPNVVKATTEALKTAADNAVKDVVEKQKAYDEASKGTDSAKITAALNALTAAKTVATNTQKAYTEYVATGKQKEENAVNSALNTALNNAATAKTKADADAKKAYNDLWSATGTDTANKKAADAKVVEESKNMDKAATALITVSKAYNNNLKEYTQTKGATPIDVTMINDIADGVYNDKDGYSVRATDLTANKLIILDKAALTYVVQVRSNSLYGTTIWKENAYGDFEARLKELGYSEIETIVNNEMKERADKELPITLDIYMRECNNYGLAGKYMAIKEQIRIAKSWLENKDVINGKITQVQNAIDELTKAFKSNEDAIAAKWDAFDTAANQLSADLDATIEPITKKRAELEPLEGLYHAILHAIEDYTNAGEAYWTEETIQNWINFCKASIETYKIEVYEAETALMQAKDHLAKWNSDAIDELQLRQILLEEAQAKVDRKKLELDAAQKALDDMLAKLSAE